MQLYIIRHCQSENNALWMRTGSDNGRFSDPALTELGHKQAQYLANYLIEASTPKNEENARSFWNKPLSLNHLYCSLMRRSIQTGSYISEALNLPLVGLDNIHERGGIYLKNSATQINEGLPGPNREEFQSLHPQLILPETIGSDGWWNRAYEEKEAAINRAGAFFTWLEEKHGGTDDRIAIVSHGGFIQSLFMILLDGSLLFQNGQTEREIWIKSNNGSISRIDFWKDGIRLTYLNRIDFYPAALIS